jgi:NhaP-type Na+/H+ or K+/H+ antiporter
MWEKYQEQTDGLRVLGDSMIKWAGIDPHVFLFIFLPALLYEASGSVDVHIFGRAGMQMLLLAGPGVIISTGLVAVVVQYIFDYGWDWQTALCFGSMLSATDPVAVVALLKELGASKRLSLLIEGESLLNDGTAMVVFMVFEKSMGEGAAPLTGASVGESFLQLAGGGVVLGWVLGQITVFMLANIIDDPACEITLTVTAAYGGFFLAEASAIGASGVLTVVVIGLVMSYSGKTAVSPSAEHLMHEFWEMMGFLANTIIFILSGLIIVEKYHDDSIRQYDWALCIVLWVALNFIRGLTIMLLSPLLTKMGYGLTFAQALVITWGGLRGAVGLALAMIVEHDPNVKETVGQLFLFHMAGIVILTLVVNGSTTGMLVRYLRLHKGPSSARVLFENAALAIDTKLAKSVSTLKHNPFYSDADWAMVWNMMPVFTQNVFEKRMRREPGFAPKASTVKKAFKAMSDSYFEPREEKMLAKVEVLAAAKQASSMLVKGANRQGRRRPAFKASSRSKVHVPGLENSPKKALENSLNGTEKALEIPPPFWRRSLSEEVMQNPEVSDVAMMATQLTGPGCEAKLESFRFQQHARHTFFTLVKANYWRQFETGFTSNSAHKALVDGANRAEDASVLHDVMLQGIDEWSYVEGFTEPPWFWSTLACVPVVARVADYYLEMQLALSYDIANSFIFAHKESANTLTRMLEVHDHHVQGDAHDEDADRWGEDGDAEDRDNQSISKIYKRLVEASMDGEHKAVCFEVLSDASHSIDRAQAYLDDVKQKFPGIAVSIATKSVCYALLEDMKQHAHHLSHHGELEEKEVGIIEKALLKSRKKLHFQFSSGQQSGQTMSPLHLKDMLSHVPFFQLLEPQLQDLLLSRADTLEPRHRGAALFRQGNQVDGVYVIVRGTVKVMVIGKDAAGQDGDVVEFERLGAGEVVGLLEVVKGRSKRLVSAECESSVQAILIPSQHVQQVLQQTKMVGAKEAIWQDVACTEVMLHRRSLPLFTSLTPTASRLLLSKARLYHQMHPGRAPPQQQHHGYSAPGRGLLVQGAMQGAMRDSHSANQGTTHRLNWYDTSSSIPIEA